MKKVAAPVTRTEAVRYAIFIEGVHAAAGNGRQHEERRGRGAIGTWPAVEAPIEP